MAGGYDPKRHNSVISPSPAMVMLRLGRRETLGETLLTGLDVLPGRTCSALS